ncbi:MAG: PAS domain S-box protein [Deltaproteobacteria bacterium]|nr:PAS domain S-box protein [Deltaproteobacteria bacterium]
MVNIMQNTHTQYADLQEAKERLEAMINAFDGMIYVCSKDYRIEFMNEPLIRRSGYDATGGLCYEVLHGLDSVCPWCVNQRVFQGETVHWEVLSPKDNRWYQIINTPLYKAGVVVAKQALILDITERKHMEEKLHEKQMHLEQLITERTLELIEEQKRLKAEIVEHRRTQEELRASEETNRSIVEHIGVGIALISPAMEILSLNGQMRTWFPDIDLTRKPLCYRAFNDPPRKTVCAYCPTIRSLQDGQVHEGMAATPRGQEIRNYRIVASPLKDRDGRILGAIEMVSDVTESVRAQQSLQETEIRYRTIFESTGTAMMLVNEDMTIAGVNGEFERQSGLDRRDIEGRKTWTEFVSPRDLRKMKTYHRRRRIDPTSAPASYEYRFADKNGKLRDVLATVAMIPGTTMSVASLVDITELKQALENLKDQRQQLAEETRRLQEVNTALKVLLRHREEDRTDLEKQVLTNVRKLVLPFVEKLKRERLTEPQAAYLQLIEDNLKSVISPFLQTLTSRFMNMTPKEIQIAGLVRNGKTAKEIAELLNVSARSIEFHKDNIRRKLGLIHKKTNLMTYLRSLTDSPS